MKEKESIFEKSSKLFQFLYSDLKNISNQCEKFTYFKQKCRNLIANEINALDLLSIDFKWENKKRFLLTYRRSADVFKNLKL
jgi:hypothetical protein